MRLFAAVVLALLRSTASAAAVGAEKALYVGGTLKQFPARSGSPVRVTVGAPKVEGTIDITDDRLVFTAGRSGSVEVPYVAISTLHYGVDAAQPAPKGLVLFIPWDPTEQFPRTCITSSRSASAIHRILIRQWSSNSVAISFARHSKRLSAGLETLWRSRTWTHAPATKREECGYGSTAELKGLKKVGLDAGMRNEDRASILAALKTNPADVEVLNSTEGAEIVLKFESVRSPNPQCPL